MGCMAASEVCGQACSRRPWEPSLAWSQRACVWEGEGEGRRSKANTALWVKAMTSTGLCPAGLNHLLALCRVSSFGKLAVQ